MKRKTCYFKADRRLMQNTWSNNKSSFIKKPYGPGQHKSTFVPRKPFALAFREYRKLMTFYANISKQYLVNLYKKFKKNNIILLLERRIDTILFRSSIVRSPFEARQLISHRHVFINDKSINKSSFILKVGDKIKFSKIRMPFNVDMPSYLSYDNKENTLILREEITDKDIIYPFNLDVREVISYISR